MVRFIFYWWYIVTLIPYDRITVSNKSIYEMQRAIVSTIQINKNRNQMLRRDYFLMILQSLKQRRKIWNSVFMSSLKENNTVFASENECVISMKAIYYQSCKYSYPFDNELMQLLRSLCRFRKSSGVYVLRNSMFCEKQNPNLQHVVDVVF